MMNINISFGVKHDFNTKDAAVKDAIIMRNQPETIKAGACRLGIRGKWAEQYLMMIWGQKIATHIPLVVY